MKLIFYISLIATIISCSNPDSFSNSGPPKFADGTNVSGFVEQTYGENNPLSLEEIEERSLPPTGEQNIFAETIAQPVPITGAPLTCVVSANNETFCKVDDESQPDVNWKVYNEQEEMLSSEYYEVQSLPPDSYWDVKIIFNEPVNYVSVEAEDADAEADEDSDRSKNKKKKKKSKAKSKVYTDYNFEQMLTGSYSSPQWGALDLVVNPDLSVTGSYTINNLEGSLFGTLDLSEARISGSWEERNEEGTLKHSGELIFNVVLEGKSFYLDGSYSNEGDKKWHDWDLFPEDLEKKDALFAL